MVALACNYRGRRSADISHQRHEPIPSLSATFCRAHVVLITFFRVHLSRGVFRADGSGSNIVQQMKAVRAGPKMTWNVVSRLR